MESGSDRLFVTKCTCNSLEITFSHVKLHTVEQEIFATGNFREFRPQAIRVEEIFAIRVQEIFANLTNFAKFAKISCTRKFVVLQ